MKVHLLMLAAFGLFGCGLLQRHEAPTLFETYADRGPLPVRGAPRSAPGPAIYRALAADGAPQLAGRGEPDTLEVVKRGAGQRVIVTYRRGRGGTPRRIVVWSKRERNKRPQQASARAPRPRPRAPVSPTVMAGAPEPSPVDTPKTEPSPAKMTLTARQALECPIDTERADCQSVCADGGRYEWCR